MIEITTRNIDAKPIAGMYISTSPASSQALQIWQKFMPRRKELDGPEEDVYYSIQDYPSDYPWEAYDPTAQFTTWAVIEINDDSSIPDDFSATLIKGGLYAFFIHKGTAASIAKSMIYFHSQWLPKSGYFLDKSRMHFERLGKKFLGPENPASEEEVYIPILPISK